MHCTLIKGAIFPAIISQRDIITHQFYVNYNEGGTGIVYDMIIDWYLMVKLGPIDYLKRNVLEWYVTTVSNGKQALLQASRIQLRAILNRW